MKRQPVQRPAGPPARKKIAPARNRGPEAAGVPRYLTRPSLASAEHEARAAAGRWPGTTNSVTPLREPSSAIAEGIARGAAGGRPLPGGWRDRAALPDGFDAGRVRIHAGAEGDRVAARFGANAVTVGRDIFFASGRYDPESSAGARLLAHELTHVAQQGGQPRAVQCDLAMTLPVPLGGFDVDMIARNAPAVGANAGMEGTIGFDPDPSGPYSAEIGLVQAVKVTDVGGVSTTAGEPLDWGNIPGGHPEEGRMEMMTGGLGAAQSGWFIDSETDRARGAQRGPNYIEHFISSAPQNQFGYLRSPTDVRRASLWDFPGSPIDLDFDFETVARGNDTTTVYGSLFWGFGVRGGAVQDEYARAQSGATATFDAALERYRDFFVHEPVVLYFDLQSDMPRAGEDARLADVPDYLARYPDVEVTIAGFADVRGGEDANFDLAERRAQSVAGILTLMGVPANRITNTFGMGRTTAFSQHGVPSAGRQRREEGLLQSNRRVVVSFDHTMSNHPIVP